MLEKEAVEKVMMKQPGYATPKIDVRAAVIKDDKILLVQEILMKKWIYWINLGIIFKDY